MTNGFGEQVAQGQATADGAGIIEGQRPAADCSGHGQGGLGAAGGDRLAFKRAIAGERGIAAGGAAALEGPHPAPGVTHQPEAVAADGVHVRIDDGNRRGHGDHGLDGVAAQDEDIAAGLGCQLMGRRDGPVAENLGRTHMILQSAAVAPCGAMV